MTAFSQRIFEFCPCTSPVKPRNSYGRLETGPSVRRWPERKAGCQAVQQLRRIITASRQMKVRERSVI